MLRVNFGVGKGKRGRCPKSSGFVGGFAAVQAGRFVQPFVCLFLPLLALQDLRALLEELTQESNFAPAGPVLTHWKPSPKQAVPKLESLQRNPGRARQGLRTFPMEADRTLSLLSLSGRRSRGGLITVTRTLVRKYPGRNNKPGS